MWTRLWTAPWTKHETPKARESLLGNRSISSACDEVAGGPGFEPRLTESESAVLPLNYPPAGRAPQRSSPMRTPLTDRFEEFKPRDEIMSYRGRRNGAPWRVFNSPSEVARGGKAGDGRCCARPCPSFFRIWGVGDFFRLFAMPGGGVDAAIPRHGKRRVVHVVSDPTSSLRVVWREARRFFSDFPGRQDESSLPRRAFCPGRLVRRRSAGTVEST